MTVKSLYSCSEVCVRVGGVTTQPFTEGVGLQEEYVLSQLLLLIYISGITNLSLTMYPFSISTDEHVPLKFLMTKHFIMTNHIYIYI